MRRRRWNGQGSWRDWLWSALLGVGLALLCIIWLSGRTPETVPAAAPVSSAAEWDGERSLGFEFTVRFRILLPRDKDG